LCLSIARVTPTSTDSPNRFTNTRTRLQQLDSHHDAAPSRGPISRPQPAEPLKPFRTSQQPNTTATTAATPATPAAEHTTPRLRRRREPGPQPEPLQHTPGRLPVECSVRRRSRRCRTRSSSTARRGRGRNRTRRPRSAHAVRPRRTNTRECSPGTGWHKRHCRPADTRSLAVEPAPRDGHIALAHRSVSLHQHGQYTISLRVCRTALI
jgi:hypothetical protein